MADSKTYCESVREWEETNLHRIYHDTEYGFPLLTDNELFGRLILEINQAGLSWTTILKKKENFREAYSNFDIATVAQYTEADRQRLLSNAGIIRNKLKVNAAIVNAQRIQKLQVEYGSFKNWLDHHHPKTRKEWVKLFKKHFKFTGGEITNEFLLSTGYLKGAHEPDCSVYHQIMKLSPKWAEQTED